ncbi:ABC transporter permease [Roseomonas sp. BN140053]|uniref:ABC transporter permease n=1 Tax=Roseomonas sp. BN140053 TaxID=3391898 RepID=UPI0039E904FB
MARLLSTFRARPAFALACLILAVLIVVALLAPWIAPGDIDAQDLGRRLKPPGWMDAEGNLFLAGTDNLGRDIAGRLVHGSRISLTVGVLAVLFGGGLGLTLGLLAGYYGGRLDAAIMRFTDMQLAFPFLLLALALVTILGPGVFNVILVLAITSWINYAKVIRGDVLQIRNREFIQAAVALGLPSRRIIFRHVLPNVFPSFLVVASFQVAALIIAESSLSFLGLGIPTSVPSWGSMLADGREYVTDAWWLSVFPGLAIMLAALSFNILGDGLRDLMDPTQRISRRRTPSRPVPARHPPATEPGLVQPPLPAPAPRPVQPQEASLDLEASARAGRLGG